jgi:hypothetical protein
LFGLKHQSLCYLRDFVVEKISELLSKTTIEPTNSPHLTKEHNPSMIPKVEPLMSLFKEEVDLITGNQTNYFDYSSDVL